VQVAGWLRRFHEAVLDFDPGVGAVWRGGGLWHPGLMNRPQRRCVEHSRVPLHARDVVEPEGFTHFGDRRRRLELSLGEYSCDQFGETSWMPKTHSSNGALMGRHDVLSGGVVSTLHRWT